MTEQELIDEWVDEQAEFYISEADYTAAYLLEGPGPDEGLPLAA